MTREELKGRYNSMHNRMSKIGRSTKIGLLAALICYSTLRLLGGRGVRNIESMSPIQIMITGVVITTLFCVILIVPIKSFDFLSYRRANEFKNSYKKDLFSIIRNESSEIVDHISYQKIHPLAFKKSKLFDEKFTDYLGDDWFQGYHNTIEFELSELHVYNSFKVVFSGIFVRCFFENSKEDQINNFEKYGESFHTSVIEFQKRHKTNVLFSNIENQSFLAFQSPSKLFEYSNKRDVTQIDADLELLKDIIEITKIAIDKRA